MDATVIIAQAGNTWIPAVLTMRAKGYVVANRWVGEEEICVATKDRLRFSATDSEAVLGLITLYEARGADWMAADDEIDRVMTEFGYL